MSYRGSVTALPEPTESSQSGGALRFMRALLVGGGATLTDFSVFTLCVRGFSIAPSAARLPALLAGASLQFFGSRHYAFRAQSGNLSRQALLFALFEVVSVALNWVAFQFLLPRLAFLAPELVTIITSSTIFLLYNYPTRRLIIFRLGETRS